MLGFVLLRAAQHDVLNAMFMEPDALPALILSIGTRLVAAIAVATIVLVAADLVWTRLFWARELRMTRQEVKDEMKQVGGRPHRQGAAALAGARPRAQAHDRRGAAGHLRDRQPDALCGGVALREGGGRRAAGDRQGPGSDRAQDPRDRGTQHSIPIIEDKLLARSLYKAVEVDKMIPPEFYKAVAEIVFFLFSRRG